MRQNPTSLVRPAVAPSIWLFVSSTADIAREWMFKECLRLFPGATTDMVRLIRVDVNTEAEHKAPSTGDATLDAATIDPGSFFPLSVGTVDLAAQLNKGNFRHLRFAPLELMQLANPQSGSRNAPTLAHVAFLWNRTALRAFLSAQIEGVLESAAQVRSIEAGVDIISADLQVFIVWSPGGTGTGIALACGELTRDIATDLNLEITLSAIKLRPGAFASSAPQRLQANAYANDMELAAAQSGKWVRAVHREEVDE